MDKTLNRFFGFLFRKKKAFLAFLLVGVTASVFGHLNSYLYKILIDTIPSKNYRVLLYILFLFVGLRIGANWLSTWAYYLGDKVAIPTAAYIRQKIFKHVQELDFAFHASKKTGSLISAFKRGDAAFWGLFFNFREVLGILVGLLVTLFFFSQLSFWLVAVMLGIFLINTIVGYFLIRMNVKRRKGMNKSEDEITGIIADNFLNYETVKYFAGEEKEKSRLKKAFTPFIKKAWKYGNSFRIMDISIGTLSGLGMLVLLWISLFKFRAGTMTGGSLVMVLSFTTSFYFSFFRLLYQARNVAKRFEDLKRYFGLLDKESRIKEPASPKEIKELEGKIEFRNVSFDYPKGRGDALVDFNLYVEPGEVVAFVGRSGSGKTTVVKLLFRLYNLKQGKILVDEVNIKDLRKEDLRSFIGIVPQEPILFNDTIGFNISFGTEDSSRREIKRVAEMANLWGFIKSLPEGLDTPVGERGIKLSGGQKQRLAIARMLLEDPKVTIFDEATSQLDSESEALIQDAFWKASENRTVFIIAHRFSTLRNADRIVVLENGCLVEEGTHRELIEEEGLYKHLWELQAKKKFLIDSDLPR